MHIALVSPAWPPESNSNGVVTYVKWMRDGLIRNGCRVSVLAFALDDSHREPDVYHIDLGHKPASIFDRLRDRVARRKPSAYDGGPQAAAALSRVHDRAPIDVVEMEEAFGWAATVKESTGIPTVVKLHGPTFLTLREEEQRTPFVREKMRREGMALARLPFVLSPSRGHLEQTIAHYHLHPALAEHLVNPLALRPGAALWDPATCGDDGLLFVGRFDTIKGGDTMIRAFQSLWLKRPSLRLTFVGPDDGLTQPDGSKMGIAAYIESLGDPGLAEAISIRGRLSPDEIAALRTQSVACVVPSRCESQGYTALEAMLQGCPVVCTDASGLTELIEHGVNGLKARVGDADDLARQIASILADRDLGARLGAKARRYVLDHHEPEAVARSAIDFYRRAIALSSAAGMPSPARSLRSKAT